MINDIVNTDLLRTTMQEYHAGKRMPRFSTGWPDLIDNFNLLRGNLVLLSGYGNHGKGTFVRQMALQMYIKHQIKWAFWSPEDMPAEYFYADLIHTLTGRSTELNHSNFIDYDNYINAFDVVRNAVKLIDFNEQSPTPENVISVFDQSIDAYGCNGFVIDPFNNMQLDFNMYRDDQFIRNFCINIRKWTVKRDVFLIVVLHPKSPNGVKTGVDTPCPSYDDLHYGSEWSKFADDIIFYHHPTFKSEPQNVNRILSIAKLKKQKISGKRGNFGMIWDFMTNRIYDASGLDGFGSILNIPDNLIAAKADANVSKLVRIKLIEDDRLPF